MVRRGSSKMKAKPKKPPTAAELRHAFRTAPYHEALGMLTKENLTILGWRVHSDNPKYLGATKETEEGQRLELNYSKERNQLAGFVSNGWAQKRQVHPLLHRISRPL